LIETRWHLDRYNKEEYAKFKANYEKTVPLARAATPDDVAEVAVWLIEGADLVTGESILVDAGLHLGKF
jgi:3-oxoacyl-[acyl-carrier protein] reductase